LESPTLLVVSNPPHGEVRVEAAAAVLGLPTDDARLKMRFSAPEILAAADPNHAADMALSLKAAGVRVEMRDGAELARLPWPTLVSSWEFGDAGLDVRAGSESVEIRYDEPVFGVFCEPPSDFRAPAGVPDAADGMVRVGPVAAEALEWVAHLDLYYQRSGVPRRLSIAGGSMVAMVDECRTRFHRLEIDARLEGVRPRRRFLAGEQGFDLDMRKRYAFGTLLLRHVLESISPDLRDVTQYELGSRLAYVLKHGARL